MTDPNDPNEIISRAPIKTCQERGFRLRPALGPDGECGRPVTHRVEIGSLDTATEVCALCVKFYNPSCCRIVAV